MQRDFYKKSTKKENFKKQKKGDTEVSYQKKTNIDPGGEYVDFEDLN